MGLEHLGGLPNIGSVIVMRERASDVIKRSVRALMHHVVSDELTWAEVVAAGPTRFRQVFVKDLGAFFNGNRIQADNLADLVYRFFAVQWREKHPDLSAEQFLDRVEIKAPPTEAEIEDAWELEIASDERAMRTMYDGGQRIRKGKDLGELKTRLD